MYSETALPSGQVIWRSFSSAAAVVPADGSADLILRDDAVFVAGPSTRWIATLDDGAEGSFGVRFAPGDFAVVLPIPLQEISDQLVPLADLSSRTEGAAIRDAMLRARAMQRMLLDRSDELRLLQASSDAWVPFVRSSANRAVRGALVAQRLGWTPRTFRRRMLTAFGYSYGTLVRLRRMQRAQSLLREGTQLAAVAVKAGYSDQPHFSREFKRLVGSSPRQFAGSAA
ncbi:helix-turn-helix domain-containing protein [Humidisolicoccus flavus]|uniref:helix-turn-helix domain-containing protein n=1 Tax=Humidisolicoccus flavus TaxID=3111414 RepID=UPI0032561C1D